MENQGQGSAFKVGEAYIIRTVTYHYTGRLERVVDGWMVLSNAAWIADSGRWATALESGALNEIEPYPSEVTVNMDAIVDISPWSHPLPREQR